MISALAHDETGALGGRFGPKRADKCFQSRPRQAKAIGLGKGCVELWSLGKAKVQKILSCHGHLHRFLRDGCGGLPHPV